MTVLSALPISAEEQTYTDAKDHKKVHFKCATDLYSET